jgi:hypothetical protein
MKERTMCNVQNCNRRIIGFWNNDSNDATKTIIVQFLIYLHVFLGHTIALTVRLRFHTAVVRVRAWVKSCGICAGQSGTEAGLFRVLLFQ